MPLEKRGLKSVDVMSGLGSRIRRIIIPFSMYTRHDDALANMSLVQKNNIRHPVKRREEKTFDLIFKSISNQEQRVKQSD